MSFLLFDLGIPRSSRSVLPLGDLTSSDIFVIYYTNTKMAVRVFHSRVEADVRAWDSDTNTGTVMRGLPMSRLTRRGFIKQSAAFASVASVSRYAFAAEFSYKFANELPESHPVNVHASRAADAIREATAGSVDIRIFPNSQLGSQTDMLSQVRAGAIEFVPVSGIILSTLVPVASIHGLGFIFSDYDNVWKAMDGDLGRHIRADIEKSGLFVFENMWDTGFRHVTSSTKPIENPDDIQNFKIRVPVSPLWTSMFRALGAAPVSINFGEVYTSLQTRIVDGQETTLSLVESMKFFEVQKCCSLTSHMFDGPWLVANRRAWNRLPEKSRDIVQEKFREAALAEREDSARLNEQTKVLLESHGMVFNEPDRALFGEVLRKAGFYREWKSRYGNKAWGILERYSSAVA